MRAMFHRARATGSVVLVLLGMTAARAFAATTTYTGRAVEDAEARKEDKPSGDLRPTTGAGAPHALTPQEVFEALKHEAEHKLAEKKAHKWFIQTYGSWSGGVESNPNLVPKGHKTDFFMEEYGSVTGGYHFFPALTWQTSYSLDSYNYSQFTDLDTLTNTLTTKLLYQMIKPLRLEAHYSFIDNAYVRDRSLSSQDQKIHLRLRHTFLKNYYHYLGWTYLYKQYEDKLIRNGAGTRIAGKRRKDTRHTGTYEIGGYVGENLLLRLKQDVYFNESNDHFQDFYDLQDYKVRLSGIYNWNPQWSSSAGFTYDIKRYEQRVNTAARPVKQRDYAKTYDFGLTYKINHTFDVTYDFRFLRNTSNEVSQSYNDATNTVTLSASF